MSLGVARFEATDRGTRLTTRSVFPSVEARDGMEYGVSEGYDRLDELLADHREAAR